MGKPKVKFVGIDGWSRPIFKLTTGDAYYGCLEILFNPGDRKEDVRESVDDKDLVYFGASFDCEPDGSQAEVQIDWEL